MKKAQNLCSLLLSIALLLPISGCSGNSKGPSDDGETPVEVGDEESLALPPNG